MVFPTPEMCSDAELEADVCYKRGLKPDYRMETTGSSSDVVVGASFLDTVEGEIAFFKSLTRARPVGVNRYFHVLTMQNLILKETGNVVHIEDIWTKVESCYNLEQLETIDLEQENYESKNSKSSPIPIPSPSPSQNLSAHPFFREEYMLPYEDFETIIAQRRLRDTASAPSSPAPATRQKRGATRRRRKSRLEMTGLIGGDSDSSALTLESGDERPVSTPRESVNTGTDAGTDYAEEEEVEVESTPASIKPPRGRGKPRGRPPGRGRTVTRTSTRASTKKKR